jgi:hypothetical protein
MRKVSISEEWQAVFQARGRGPGCPGRKLRLKVQDNVPVGSSWNLAKDNDSEVGMAPEQYFRITRSSHEGEKWPKAPVS